jgi:hypothetical protein
MAPGGRSHGGALLATGGEIGGELLPAELKKREFFSTCFWVETPLGYLLDANGCPQF